MAETAQRYEQLRKGDGGGCRDESYYWKEFFRQTSSVPVCYRDRAEAIGAAEKIFSSGALYRGLLGALRMLSSRAQYAGGDNEVQ